MPKTPDRDLMDQLSRHRALGKAPKAEHAWLVAHGTRRTYNAGEVVTVKGTQAKALMVLFTGHVVIRGDRGAGSHKIFEWRAGDVGGTMPYSRGASPPADAVAEEISDALTIAKESLPQMIRECPQITTILVHTMVDRARQFTSSDLRDEKLISLGKLASGLAHELNNPASAVVRSAKMLAGSLTASEDAARKLGAAGLSDAQLTAIDAVRRHCAVLSSPEGQSPLARADREDAIAEWLGSHGANPACAGPLSETAITLDALNTLAAAVDREALDATLRWLSAGCSMRMLTGEIETAATRIYDLVAAVKGFSYMDRAPTPEPVDLRRGIAETLTVLGGKIRAKSVVIALELPEDLPRAHAVGAEVNQVWMNLIDNAIDAVAAGGHITVSAGRELDRVVVRIIDDGLGIPPEIQARIFEPFFTTKGVGKGSGLGLDIVRRLLRSYDGEVAVESIPSRTEFQVRLLLA